MKTQFNFNEEQIRLLSELVDTSIDALEDCQLDMDGLSDLEKKELDNLYELSFELSYSNLEKTLGIDQA